MIDEAERARLRRRRRKWFENREDQHTLWPHIVDTIWAIWREHGDPFRPPKIPAPHFDPFPDEFRGLTCGAKTRAGTPCKRTDLYINGRCKLHGGLSTGPRTDAGKAVASQNARKKRSP